MFPAVISNEALANITLTSVTVVLAVLATIIGVVSLLGFRFMRAEAKRVAETAALLKITEYLDSAEIKAKLKGVIDKRIAEEGNLVYDDLSLAMAGAFPDTGTDPDAALDQEISDEYPEEEAT